VRGVWFKGKKFNHLGLALLGLYMAAAVADDFPAPPPTVDDAITSGLRRVPAEEIAQAYPGARMLKAYGGEVVRLQLRSDGSLDYTDDRGVSDTGNWAVLPRNGGTLCRRYSKMMGGRVCVIYYAAPDGLHWFGFSAESGQWRDTTRSLETR
jgi:hypothetical protein